MNHPVFGRVPESSDLLICFPHAGGSATTFRDWQLRSRAAILPVRLRGRAQRFHDLPFETVEEIIAEVVDAISRLPATARYAFYGHSFGGMLAVEAAHATRSAGVKQPVGVIVAGTQPLCLPRVTPHYDNDSDLVDWLRTLGGLPAEIESDRELLSVVLPALRADIRAYASHQRRKQPPLQLPLAVMSGSADPLVSLDQLHLWSGESSAGTDLFAFPGGHFFVEPPSVRFMELVTELIARWLAQPSTDERT